MLNLPRRVSAFRRSTDSYRLAISVAVQKASISRWSRLYEDFVNSNRLTRLQNQFFEVENECLRSQNIRLCCQNQLTAMQTRLKDLHTELKDVSTVDKRYPVLFSEELRALKAIHAHSYDFQLYEEAEKESFLSLERLVGETRKEEWEKAKRCHRFLIYACLTGLTVGIAGAVASYYLQNYLFEDPSIRDNKYLRQLATELASGIQSRNNIIQACLKDLAVRLGTTSALLGHDQALILPSAEDEVPVVLTNLQEALPVFKQKNDENCAEMNRLWTILLNSRQAPNLHIYLLPSEEQEAKTATDISALWSTTFIYSVLIVGVPLAYSLLT